MMKNEREEIQRTKWMKKQCEMFRLVTEDKTSEKLKAE